MSRFAAIALATAGSAVLFAVSPAAAVDSTHGAIEGTTTSLGGAPLNGMCGVLYDKRGTQEIAEFAPTGTDGTSGHYIQGQYRSRHLQAAVRELRRQHRRSRTGLSLHADPLRQHLKIGNATKIVVRANAVTTLAPQPVPYGGVVQGVVKDTTTGQGADTPVVAMIPPDGDTFFLSFSWTLLCADSTGHYNTTSGFQQGVPDGSKVIFRPGRLGLSG
ncbi:MAG: hypothetical protein WDM89_11660 [Rhizomicrobium sp.]